jgi:DNA-binding LacI/PurR family transcriptional regulator
MIGRKKVSAAVAVNDAVAVPLIDYLKIKKVRIPDDFAVVSFDDSEIAFQYEITSYNFAFPAIAQNVLSFLIRPKASVYATSDQRMECEGFIVRRETTAVYSKANEL